MTSSMRHDMHGQWPQALTPNDIAQNVAATRQRIAAACERAGRDPHEVRLLPVSKTKPVEVIRAAYAAGVRDFGENKPQEAHGKWEETQDLSDARWCIIGHLQRNKAGLIAPFAAEFHALDSQRLAETLERRLEPLSKTLDVFVQVNTSGEESKYGIAPEEVTDFVSSLAPYEHLNIKGLMTLALFSSEQDRVRQCFVRLRECRDRLREEGLPGELLSMGMSGDFEIAIEEGANIVRVGQAIFGARPTADSHYWPAK